MLTISTLQEALSALHGATNRPWTESELFDFVTTHGIELHAAAPMSASTAIHEFVIGEGLVTKFTMPPGHSPLAVLFPWQVGQLWIGGETETRHPSDHDRIDGQMKWYVEPVHVKRDQLRVTSESMRKIITEWKSVQPLPKVSNEPTLPPNDWRQHARSYATQEWQKRPANTNPSKSDLAAKVRKRFQEEGLQGPRGPLSSETILREALTPWTKPGKPGLPT